METNDRGENADLYEFDAPSHVTDLNLQQADDADSWFEQQETGQLVTPQRHHPVHTQEDSAPSTTSNIVTSWAARDASLPAARPTATSSQCPAQPRRVSKRKEIMSSPAAAPPTKKQKSGSTGQPARNSSSNRCRSGRLASRRGARTRESAAPPCTRPKTSEEMEMERIRKLQEEVALHRRQNEASYKAALAGRSSSSSDPPSKKGTTVPKPFSLSAGERRKPEEPAAYVPMAELVERFQKRTPERYHLRSRRSQERGPSPLKNSHLKLTQPHTPHLMTRQRSRPPTVKSSAELEAEELEKVHKFKFKALELNRKILENTESLKKPAVKEPTVPEGFELQVEKRLQERQATKKPQETEEKQHMFKSQPLPTKILEGVVGLPEKKFQPPTVPESPAFALKKRIRMDRKVEEVKQPSPIKAPPVPHFGLPFQPRLPESHHVEVCPFSFEERERERRALKEKRLEEMQNEEVPKFKAQLLPDFDVVVLPEKKKLEPTKPEPFRLLIDERGAVKTARWEQMVKEEQKQQEEAATFKARPNTVTHKEPFQPKKESRTVLGTNSSTVAEAFELSTERRARERQEFEQQVSEKEALRACMEEKQRREEEQHEKEEILKLRQEQVHKAQPVRRYKPVAVKKSGVPLTVPQSPNFSDRFRL